MLACAGFLTGCSPAGSNKTNDQAAGNDSDAEPPQEHHLHVLTNRVDLIENGVFKRYADAFERKHPSTVVEFEGLTNYATDILVRLSLRNLGDVLLLPNSLANQELSKYFEPLKPGMFKHLRFADFKEYEGMRYGIATGASTEGIVYNKQAFVKAGITEIPTTLAALYEACEKLKKAGIVPIYLNYGAQWPLPEWGETLVSFMTGNANYLNEMVHTDRPWQISNAWGQAVTIARTLIQRGYVEKDLFSNNWELSKSEIAEGKSAMYFTGNWVIKQIFEAGGKSEDIGFFPFPYDNQTKHYAPLNPDWFIGINKLSENQTLAQEWVDY
ncbi:ABC transporter substrate-binding protein [Paenibacillus solisilvae]|uniref:ABC transporter substrate-binding protein n=1 Tax=Paenibacillus solisilvae TaxID=2486751 RepID=A0ABW0W6Q5_9BACL